LIICDLIQVRPLKEGGGNFGSELNNIKFNACSKYGWYLGLPPGRLTSKDWDTPIEHSASIVISLSNRIQ